jgi:hypothetical protein
MSKFRERTAELIGRLREVGEGGSGADAAAGESESRPRAARRRRARSDDDQSSRREVLRETLPALMEAAVESVRLSQASRGAATGGQEAGARDLRTLLGISRKLVSTVAPRGGDFSALLAEGDTDLLRFLFSWCIGFAGVWNVAEDIQRDFAVLCADIVRILGDHDGMHHAVADLVDLYADAQVLGAARLKRVRADSGANVRLFSRYRGAMKMIMRTPPIEPVFVPFGAPNGPGQEQLARDVLSLTSFSVCMLSELLDALPYFAWEPHLATLWVSTWTQLQIAISIGEPVKEPFSRILSQLTRQSVAAVAEVDTAVRCVLSVISARRVPGVTDVSVALPLLGILAELCPADVADMAANSLMRTLRLLVSRQSDASSMACLECCLSPQFDLPKVTTQFYSVSGKWSRSVEDALLLADAQEVFFGHCQDAALRTSSFANSVGPIRECFKLLDGVNDGSAFETAGVNVQKRRRMAGSEEAALLAGLPRMDEGPDQPIKLAALVNGILRGNRTPDVVKQLSRDVIAPWISSLVDKVDNPTFKCSSVMKFALGSLLEGVADSLPVLLSLCEELEASGAPRSALLDVCALLVTASQAEPARDEQAVATIESLTRAMGKFVAWQSVPSFLPEVTISDYFRSKVGDFLSAPAVSAVFRAILPQTPVFLIHGVIARAEATALTMSALKGLVRSQRGDTDVSVDTSMTDADDEVRSTNSSSDIIQLICDVLCPLRCAVAGTLAVRESHREIGAAFDIQCSVCMARRKSDSTDISMSWMNDLSDILSLNDPKIDAAYHRTSLCFFKHTSTAGSQSRLQEMLPLLPDFLVDDEPAKRETAHEWIRVLSLEGGRFAFGDHESKSFVPFDIELDPMLELPLEHGPSTMCPDFSQLLRDLILSISTVEPDQMKCRVLDALLMILAEPTAGIDAHVAVMATLLSSMQHPSPKVSAHALGLLVDLDSQLNQQDERAWSCLSDMLLDERHCLEIGTIVLGAYFPEASEWPGFFKDGNDVRLVDAVCSHFIGETPARFVGAIFDQLVSVIISRCRGRQRDLALDRIRYLLSRDLDDGSGMDTSRFFSALSPILSFAFLHQRHSFQSVHEYCVARFRLGDRLGSSSASPIEQYWDLIAESEMVPILALHLGDMRLHSGRLVDDSPPQSATSIGECARLALNFLSKKRKCSLGRLLARNFLLIIDNLQQAFGDQPWVTEMLPDDPMAFADCVTGQALELSSSSKAVAGHNARSILLSSFARLLVLMQERALVFQPKIVALLEFVGTTYPLLRAEVGTVWCEYVTIWEAKKGNGAHSDSPHFFARMVVNLHRLGSLIVPEECRRESLAKKSRMALSQTFWKSPIWSGSTAVQPVILRLVEEASASCVISVPIAFQDYWSECDDSFPKAIQDVVGLLNKKSSENDTPDIERVAAGLLHESTFVCFCAVQNIHQMVVLGTPAYTEARRKVSAAFASLVACLLHACMENDNRPFATQIGQVLGAIGAVDPALFDEEFSISREVEAVRSRFYAVEKFSDDWRSPPTDEDQHSPEKLARCIVEQFIARMYEQPSTSAGQDRAASALQRLFRNTNLGDEVHSTERVSTRSQRGSSSTRHVPLSARTRSVVEPLLVQDGQEYEYEVASSVDDDSSKACFEVCTATYSEWLMMWYRRLVALVSSEYQMLYRSCEIVMRDDIRVAEEMIPHMVLNVLLQGDKHADVVIREVQAVLKNATNTYGTSGSLLATEISRVHVFVFQLIEWLRRWKDGAVHTPLQKRRSQVAAIEQVRVCWCSVSTI